jgi:hypothetical protein
MLYALSCLITIGPLKLEFVNEVEIITSIDQLTQTATIKLPKKLTLQHGERLVKSIKTDMPVEIKLGYNGELRTEFIGYVSRSPKPSMPMEIYCEDEMYMLKKNPITKTFAPNTPLPDIIKAIAPGYKLDVNNVSNIGDLVITKATPAKVLDKIRESFRQRSFFRFDDTVSATAAFKDRVILVVGKPYTSDDVKLTLPVKYHMQLNVASNSLEYKQKDDVKIKLKAVSHIQGKSDKKIVLELGDEFGEQRTLDYYNLDEANLRKIATSELEKFKGEGFKGDLTGFGIPFVKHGMQVQLIDEEYEVMDEKYLVDGVKINFGIRGFRRVVKVGFKSGVTGVS